MRKLQTDALCESSVSEKDAVNSEIFSLLFYRKCPLKIP